MYANEVGAKQPSMMELFYARQLAQKWDGS